MSASKAVRTPLDARACTKSTDYSMNKCPLCRTTLYTGIEWLERAHIPALENEVLQLAAYTIMSDLDTAWAVVHWTEQMYYDGPMVDVPDLTDRMMEGE